MPIFPIEVPAPKSGRGSTSSALARNVGLLSGVGAAPGEIVWACDYDAITLRDLARGAPHAGPVSRVPATPPAALTPSTMNSFGPDTKAAAYLAGANELLAEFTAALNECLEVIDAANRDASGSSSASSAALLACWASGVLAGYRSYPLLFVNSLKARAIQRVLVDDWVVAVPGEYESALPEYGSPKPRRETNRAPTHFSALDDSLGLAEAWLKPELSPDINSLKDSVANAFGRILLRVGSPTEGEPAVVWAHENQPGQRSIDVDLRPMRILGAFMGEQSGAVLPQAATDPALVVPGLPDESAWNTLAPDRRRLLVAIYSVALRWLRNEGPYKEGSAIGELARQTLIELSRRADADLALDDVVRLDCEATVAIASVWLDVRAGHAVDTSRLTRLLRIARSTLFSAADTGIVFDVLSRGTVALNRARTGAKGRVDVVALEAEIRACWSDYFRALTSKVQLTAGPTAVGYYFHNYAGFLGTLEDIASLRESVDHYRRFVLPSRRAIHANVSAAKPLRLALQVAARAASKIANSDDVSESEARQCADLAVSWASEALSNQSAMLLLDESSAAEESNVIFAASMLNAFACAVKFGGTVDRATLGSLEKAAERSHAWIASSATRSAERIAADGSLDRLLETIRPTVVE